MEPLLRVINLSKKFGTLPAIQRVSFEIEPGEVVGMAGSIGSGKSVLVMMLAGLYPPNEGDIYFNNQRLNWPFRAQELNIGVIHQKPELADELDVTSNIFLGNEIGWPENLRWFKIPNRRQMEQEAAHILKTLNVEVDSLRDKVANLTSEQRQMIAIARVLAQTNARLIIIDEPTVLLSYPQQQRLLSLIRDWQTKGAAVLFSSNNLEHLFAVTDRIITLRQGQKIADQRTDEISREEIMANLVGMSEQQFAPTVWAFDSYYRAREQAEKLHYHRVLIEKDRVAQDSPNQQLLDQLSEQVQAFDRANLALQEAHRRLLSEREQERKHLARELHDQVIQDLLSVNYQLEGLETDQNGSIDVKMELEEIRDGIRSIVDDLRRICGNLRPPTIDSLGLGAALQSFTRDWMERTGIKVSLELDPNLGRLPETLELSVFRIVQEGLSNVRKHAHASKVEIVLEHPSPRTLRVSIGDDGLGFPDEFDLSKNSFEGHYGLLGINERVALLGGRFHLQRRSNGGTLLLVEIPHPRVDIASELTV